jgi:uncharacterized protein (DUF111 family)
VQEYQLKKREKKKFVQDKEPLKELMENLINGEKYLRKHKVQKAFETYKRVGVKFEELQDFETASYFHKRCLDISVEYKYLEGEAKAFRGLGIAEEKVMNKD